jgi:predicted membrane-bound mannosyltransferase
MEMLPKDTSADISLRAGLFWLLAAVILVITSRMSSYGVAIWNMDEGVTAAIAEVILNGGIPYLDAVDHRGPATYYIYAAWFNLLGGDGFSKLQSLQVALMILVLMLTFGVYALGKMAGGNRIAGVAAFTFAVISIHGSVGNVRTFHTEWVLALGSLLGVLLLLRALPTRNLSLLFLSGIFFGFAFTAKQPAALDMFAACVFVSFDVLFPPATSRAIPLRTRFSSLVLCCLAIGLGFLVLPLILAAYLYSQGAWTDFITWFWRYNTELYVPMVSGADRLQAVLMPWSNGMVRGHALSFIPILLGVLLSFDLLVRLKSGIFGFLLNLGWTGRIILFSGIWFLFGWVAVNLSGRGFDHYLIQLFVPLAVISGVTFNELITRLTKWRAGQNGKNQGAKRAVSSTVALDSALIALAISALLVVNPFLKQPTEGWPQIANADLPVTMPMELANHLKERTAESDRIWVWGWLASIYVMAERQPASRFVYCTFLSGLVPWVNLGETPPLDTEFPGAWDMWEADMEAHPPVYIIDTAVGNWSLWSRYKIKHYPRLRKLIDEHYTEERLLPGESAGGEDFRPYFRIYRRNGT